MRIFIGISIPKVLQQTIAEWQMWYQEKFNPQGLRWMNKENLHITLLPPWEEKYLAEEVQKLHITSLSFKSFSLDFTKIIFIPSRKSKYLWTTGETPQDLLDLRTMIAGALGKKIERRPFRMHTTIARLQKDADFTFLEESIEWHFKVTSFALLQSQIFSTGAEYKVLEEFSLLS